MKPADVLSGSAGLPGVQWAINGRPARRMLHAGLERLLAPGCRAGPLRLTRAKFKPGDKINAYYTFTVTNTAPESAKTLPLAVLWRKSFEPGEDMDRVAQMHEEAKASDLLDPFVRLWEDIPEPGIRMQLWPMDPDFPQLVRLSSPRYAQHLLPTLGLAAPDLDGAAIAIEPVRYRPKERHVLRYRFRGGQVYYAKLYQSAQDAQRAYRIANQVVDCLESGHASCRGARPAGMSADDHVIFYPRIAGTPLSRRLGGSALALARALRTTGQALRQLHEGPLLADLKENTLEKEARVVRRASEHIQVLIPETGRQITALVERIQAQHGALPHEQPTFTHSDFKADHLLVDARGQITLIDFDTCALADPALDIGKFLADLRWVYRQAGRGGVEQAQQAFLDGYQLQGTAGRLARARLYEVLILIKITCRRVRIAAPDWAETTTAMIQQAQMLLDR